jgi:hypothetical protein
VVIFVLCLVLQAFFSFADMNKGDEAALNSGSAAAAEQSAVTSGPALNTADESDEVATEKDRDEVKDENAAESSDKGEKPQTEDSAEKDAAAAAEPASVTPMPAAMEKGLKMLALEAPLSSFVYREKDGSVIDRNTRWLKTNYSDSAVSGYRQYMINGGLLKDDVAYDFVLT